VDELDRAGRRGRRDPLRHRERRASRPANLVAPNPVTNAEFAKTFGRVLNRPTILPTPLLPLKLRYGAELVDTLLMGSQRVVPTRLQAGGYRFGFDTLEAALRAVIARRG